MFLAPLMWSSQQNRDGGGDDPDDPDVGDDY